MLLAPRVLVVEDEPVVALEILSDLADAGYEVCGVACRRADAVRKAQELQPDLVMMDVRLACGDDGIEAANEIHAFGAVPVVFLTGLGDGRTLERMLAADAAGVVLKPYQVSTLRGVVRTALQAGAALRRAAS